MPWVKVHLPVEVSAWYKGQFGRRAGVLIIAEVALLSFLSVLGLLGLVAWRTFKRHRMRRAGRKLLEDKPVQPISVLFIFAMIMELIQAFALMLTAKWPIKGAADEGSYCTAQGALYQLGMTGGAVFTSEIAIMTLLAVTQPEWILRHDRKLLYGMLAFACVFLPIMVVVPGNVEPLHYGSTGAWCWINAKPGYTGSRMPVVLMRALSDYAWVWTTSLICFASYGYVIVRWWLQADRQLGRVKDAFVMLWYPLAYFIEIFPQTVINFAVTTAALRKNAGHPHPAFFVVSNILFASSGWINVLLWSLTGRQFGFTSESTKPARRGTGGSAGSASRKGKGFERVAGDEEDLDEDAFELDLEGALERYDTHDGADSERGHGRYGHVRDDSQGQTLTVPFVLGSSTGSTPYSATFSDTSSTRPLNRSSSNPNRISRASDTTTLYSDPFEDNIARTVGRVTSPPPTHSHSLSPSSTRERRLPSFPGEDDASNNEYAQFAREMPDYGGEEFWGRNGQSRFEHEGR